MAQTNGVWSSKHAEVVNNSACVEMSELAKQTREAPPPAAKLFVPPVRGTMLPPGYRGDTKTCRPHKKKLWSPKAVDERNSREKHTWKK
ncbi:hypothetical protein AUK22_02895 [bacterium CG2_30_54_10]|nr:MAG: hypothetical protein AUK22_02895 [bacterium CG2_30_54_10]